MAISSEGGHTASLAISSLWRNQSTSPIQPTPGGAILRYMKVEEIAEAIAKLPPDQLARFRRWFTAFEAGRADHVDDSTPQRPNLAASPAARSLN